MSNTEGICGLKRQFTEQIHSRVHYSAASIFWGTVSHSAAPGWCLTRVIAQVGYKSLCLAGLPGTGNAAVSHHISFLCSLCQPSTQLRCVFHSFLFSSGELGPTLPVLLQLESMLRWLTLCQFDRWVLNTQCIHRLASTHI